MRQVAANDHYSLAYDGSKNRVYLKIVGSWMNKNEVPNYLEDIEKATGMASTNYTILSDLTEMGGMLVHDLHVKAQAICIKNGLKRVAELYSKGSLVAKAQVAEVAKDSGMTVKQFDDRDQALAWLDQAQ